MSLRSGLILRLILITALAAAGGVIWTATETYQTARQEIRATFARAGAMIERSYRLGHGTHDSKHTPRTAIDILSVMAPGTCVEFESARISRRMVCAGWQVFGEAPPAWFRKGLTRAFGPLDPIESAGPRPDDPAGERPYYLKSSFDPVAAATRAWSRAKLALTQALAMAAGILLLGAGAVLHSLRPVRAILVGIDRLGDGDLGARVAPRGATEFRRIGAAVNGLAERLQEAAAQRRALTRQLIEVEDVERRQLARDLHDEFGQTLTATNALAASIETAARPDRADIAADARAVGVNIRRMMETLRGAFARLRPPDLDEVGLAASIRTMLTGWSSYGQNHTRMAFDCDADADRLPGSVALDLYRIVQECVTNAMRHGAPKKVRVALSRPNGGSTLRLVVEDDGGGAVDAKSGGHGLLGIRERVAAMDAALSVANTDGGVRVEVLLPLGAREVAT